jgi:predicted hotdog family 3-hydroxylacyl-ACP dehydratase
MKTWPIDQVLPHAGAMVWLDRVLSFAGEDVSCERVVRRGGPEVGPDGLPSWAGIELMAQAVAAWNGCHLLASGQPVRVGFLLGTRAYRVNAATFPLGARLRVDATRVFHDVEGMAAFKCSIRGPDIEAEARLSVFSPPNPLPYLDPRNRIDPRNTAL